MYLQTGCVCGFSDTLPSLDGPLEPRVRGTALEWHNLMAEARLNSQTVVG